MDLIMFMLILINVPLVGENSSTGWEGIEGLLDKHVLSLKLIIVEDVAYHHDVHIGEIMLEKVHRGEEHLISHFFPFDVLDKCVSTFRQISYNSFHVGLRSADC